MKKKLLSLCAIILCLTFVLVGCGGNGAKFKPYAKEIKSETTGELTEVNLGTNIEFANLDSAGNLLGYLIIRDTKGTDDTTDDTYGVYSTKDAKIVYNEAKSSNNIHFIINNYYSYFTVKTDEVLEEGDTPGAPEYYTLYSPNGEKIMDNLSDIDINTNRVVKYDGAVYEYWTQQLVGEENSFATVVKVTGEKATDRKTLFSTKTSAGTVVGIQKDWSYFNFDSLGTKPIEHAQYLESYEEFDSGIERYHYYDIETGEEISCLEVNLAEFPRMFYVGNVIYIQYTIIVDPYETKDYEYMDSGDKFKTETYKFNIKTGKTTKIDKEHILTNQLYNATLLKNKADYIIASRIVNKQATSNIYYFATEDGLIEVEREYNNKLEKYGEHYIGRDNYENSYVLDKKGKVLLDLSAYDVALATPNGIAIYKDSKIGFIDYTGKFLSNGFEYDNLTLNGVIDGSFIITKIEAEKTTYYRVDEKTFAATAFATHAATGWKLSETGVVNIIFKHYFYIVIKRVEGTPTTYTYEFYKRNGTLIKSTPSIATNNATVRTFSFDTDENTAYCLIIFNNKIYQIKSTQ